MGGTRQITLDSNQPWLLFIARLLTAVGLRRASIGPPIIVSVRGVNSPALAIRLTAASTGTVGWHTEITCTSGPMWRMNSCT